MPVDTHRRTSLLPSVRALTRLVLTAAVCLLYGSLHAQEPEPALVVSFDAYPAAGLEAPDTQPVGGVPNFEQRLEVQIRRLAVDFAAPVLRAGRRTSVTARFAYRRWDLDLRQWDTSQAGQPIKSPQAFEAGGTLNRLLNNGWLMRLSLVPGLYSDFEGEVGLSDVRVRGGLAFERTLAEDVHLSLGLVYTMAYGRGLPLPTVGLRWMAAPHVLLDLMLPDRAALWYMPGDRVAFGLSAAVDGGPFRGDPDRYRVSDPETRLVLGTGGPSLLVRVNEYVRVRLDSGVTFTSGLDLYDAGTRVRTLDPRRTAFIRLGAELWR